MPEETLSNNDETTDNVDTEETTSTEPEDNTSDDASTDNPTDESTDTVESLQERMLYVEALLAHTNPNVDIEAELDNFATKRDGTLVYIGNLETKQTEETTKEAPPKNVTKFKKPSVKDAKAKSTTGTPDINTMTMREKADYYKQQLADARKVV